MVSVSGKLVSICSVGEKIFESQDYIYMVFDQHLLQTAVASLILLSRWGMGNVGPIPGKITRLTYDSWSA